MKTKSLEYLENLLKRYPELLPLKENIVNAIALLEECVRSGGTIFVCGNGGSAADAEHIVGEFMKSFMKKRPISQEMRKKLEEQSKEKASYFSESLEEGIRAISLVSGVALPTAFANDVAPDMVFAQQFYGLARPNDILWGISTSGNSTNVNNALYIARALNCKTLGLTGKDGGEMATLLDVEIRAPHNSTPIIQEFHLPIYHCICAVLEENLF